LFGVLNSFYVRITLQNFFDLPPVCRLQEKQKSEMTFPWMRVKAEKMFCMSVRSIKNNNYWCVCQSKLKKGSLNGWETGREEQLFYPEL
jgi:hypothetical protein